PGAAPGYTRHDRPVCQYLVQYYRPGLYRTYRRHRRTGSGRCGRLRPYRDAAVLLRHPGGSGWLHFDEYTDGREKPTESISDPGKFFLNAGCLLPRPHDYLSAEQGPAAHVVWRQ